MPNIDWKSSLEGEPLADIYGFTHMITARRLYEDGANIEEHQKWHSMSDELILLICAGCKARCIEIFGGDVAILDEFRRTYAELLSLGSLKAFFINQNDGDGFVQKYNIESRFLLAQHKMNEIRKALFDIYIKPIDAATWMSSTNKEKMLLPQSLLVFLGGGTEQEILSTMDCPANTVKALLSTAEEEVTQDGKPGGNNKDTPHRQATDIAFNAVYASIETHLDANGKITRADFGNIIGEAIKNQTSAKWTKPHGIRCDELWKSTQMDAYRLKRGEKLSK